MSENKTITQKKWISNGNEPCSPWNRIIWPAILNFENNLVAFNYSNNFISYQIIDDYLILNDNIKFHIVSHSDKEIILEYKNNYHRYIPMIKGEFNEKHLSEFSEMLQANKWSFLNEKNELEYIEFANSTLNVYDEKNVFLKGGVYFVFLYD